MSINVDLHQNDKQWANHKEQGRGGGGGGGGGGVHRSFETSSILSVGVGVGIQ